jgi:methyl-accepting chemotaxis protein
MSVRFFSSLRWKVVLVTSLLVTFVVMALMAILSFVLTAALSRATDDQYQGLLEARAAQIENLEIKFEGQLRATSFQGPEGDRSYSDEVDLVAWSPPNGIRTNAEGKTVDIRDRDYYQSVMAGSEFAVGKAAISRSTGQLVVIFARRAVGPDGKTQGVGLMTVDLKALSSITNTIKVGKKGYAWMADAAGQVIASPVPERLMKGLKDIPGTTGLSAGMASTDEGKVSDTLPTGERLITYFKKNIGRAGWTLMVTVPEAETLATLEAIHLLLLGMLGVGIVLAIVLAFALARSITKPIHVAAAGFRHLADGDADLTRTLKLGRKDEIGAMTDDFDTFLNRLRGIVEVVQRTQSLMKALADDLEVGADHNRAKVLSLGQAIAAVATTTNELGDSSVQSSTAAEEIARNLESLDQSIANQAASVGQASAAVEQMAGNIASVYRSTERLAADFVELSQTAEAAKDSRERSNTLLRTIADRSRALQEANRSIEDIASQTNLLAMNAAIEAAHAGASGRGFAVVAGEIRKLAEGASAQSRLISGDIKLVQDSIGAMVTASEELNSSLTKVDEKIGGTQIIVREVKEAMAEQRIGADQMLEALGSLQRLTAEVQTGSQEMTAGNQTLVQEALSLKGSAEDLRRELETMDGDTQDLGAGAEGLSGLVEKIRQSVGTMDEAVGRFKVS